MLEVTTGILIIHTAAQLEEASSLVDLLEASLALPAGAIRCSSLPGYAWSTRSSNGHGQPAQFAATLDEVGAAIALVDAAALADHQLWFDLAAAWARGKRIALLADSADRRAELPPQLADAEWIARMDRAALASLVEDLAFDLGVSPRLGRDAQRALNALSSAPPPPPPPPERAEPTEPEPLTPVSALPPIGNAYEPAPAANVYEPAVYEPAPTAYEPPPPAAATFEPLFAEDVTSEDAIELALADLTDLGPTAAAEPLRQLEPEPEPEPEAEPEPEPEPEPQHNAVSCELSLEAGRAISECSFHRDEGGDFGAELETSFGRFIDGVGGNWSELKRLGDVDVWLGATDNLLESLPSQNKHFSEWYELGFQFSTLRSIAEQGLPGDPDERAVYEQLWAQSMTAFRESAKSARIAARKARRVQSLLENLIGPEPARDYANIALSLQELRSLAEAADAS